MMMSRRQARRIFASYDGAISLKVAMALVDWEARRTREMAYLLISRRELSFAGTLKRKMGLELKPAQSWTAEALRSAIRRKSDNKQAVRIDKDQINALMEIYPNERNVSAVIQAALRDFIIENIVCYVERPVEDRPYVRWCFRERSYANITPKIKEGLEYEVFYGLYKALNVGQEFR